jgi:hypothetical protein
MLLQEMAYWHDSSSGIRQKQACASVPLNALAITKASTSCIVGNPEAMRLLQNSLCFEYSWQYSKILILSRGITYPEQVLRGPGKTTKMSWRIAAVLWKALKYKPKYILQIQGVESIFSGGVRHP